MAVVLRLPTIFAAKRFAVVRKWRVFFFVEINTMVKKFSQNNSAGKTYL
jgi:hypothetical protein